jgi:hypothetical protein
MKTISSYKADPSITANVEALIDDAAHDEPTYLYKGPRTSKRQKKPPMTKRMICYNKL